METVRRSKVLVIAIAVLTAVMMLMPGRVAAASGSSSSVEKDETVYVIQNPDGTARKTVVSDFLSNSAGYSSLADASNLKDIENVKGNEKFSRGSNGSLTWAAKGKNIYYRGSTQRETPITMSVKYYLDGDQILPEDLTGKSGDLRIKIDYQNNEKVGDVCVPFLVASTLILKDDNFSNVKIDNGKVIDDGDKQIVAGIAMPGMTESLGVSSSKISIPESLQITAKVKDFSLDTIVTVAANNVFDTMDMSSVNSLKDLDSQVNKLDSAAQQLMNGSEKLAKGANSAYAGSKKIAAGSKKLSTNMSVLHNGISDLSGKLPALAAGISKIDLGLNYGNGTALNPGLKNGLASYTAGVDSAAAGVNNTVTAIKGTIKEKNDLATGDDATKVKEAMAAYTTALANLNTAIASGDSDNISNAEKTLNDVVTKELTGAVKQNAGDAGAAQALQGVLDNSILPIQGGLSKLSAQSSTLNSGASELADGAKTLDSKVPALASGVGKLKTGSGKLSSGAETLAKGSQSLMIGNKKLASGSATLNSGMKKFYDEGIKKIVDAYNGNVKGVASRLQQMINASQDYTTFTKLENGTRGNVKFLYRTDAIEK